ncbi:hypothetical protein OG730_42395 (plasmid) [Streptomyces sp. NBC_01298]|uniref:hypothetical protein n=1 Tax=Streptomyces sp. NBC_01298 TaxID=2903817 RepID=UPI002E0EE90C|nr:hypothetical protein OG730_42395 [Streptomyces sp. NBC_01298]
MLVLLAEPGHPYDDPDHPAQWAWRYGYLELLYTPGSKTLSLSRGPKYSIGGKRSCRRCHGSGHLPWWERTAPDGTATPAVPCPTCPAYRRVFEDIPLWPVHSLDRLRHWLTARRRTAAPPAVWDNNPGPMRAGDYDEPPF